MPLTSSESTTITLPEDSITPHNIESPSRRLKCRWQRRRQSIYISNEENGNHCGRPVHIRGKQFRLALEAAIAPDDHERLRFYLVAKGGFMHIFAKNFCGGNGIVGAQVPVGAGIAFTQKYLNGNLCIIIIWRCICMREQPYGMDTSASRSSANAKYHTRCEYILGLQINDMDVFAVRQACKFAKDWVTSEKGPLILEIVTYRYGGH
ncbi:2505_t:CDS:2 [Paraglomus brasilianum]|uniref:2505_t:CDS:1 n=1 Tax=Paraglomus brasilianum TaxID=144538 RepID=A0A9N9CLP4_9GLOM|nr:2505_t:CDS:2 [Paraglomus brasilianum]